MKPSSLSKPIDDRVSFGDQDTGHVLTWHASKGLEWPIVAITELLE